MCVVENQKGRMNFNLDVPNGAVRTVVGEVHPATLRQESK